MVVEFLPVGRLISAFHSVNPLSCNIKTINIPIFRLSSRENGEVLAPAYLGSNVETALGR